MSQAAICGIICSICLIVLPFCLSHLFTWIVLKLKFNTRTTSNSTCQICWHDLLTKFHSSLLYPIQLQTCASLTWGLSGSFLANIILWRGGVDVLTSVSFHSFKRQTSNVQIIQLSITTCGHIDWFDPTGGFTLIFLLTKEFKKEDSIGKRTIVEFVVETNNSCIF